MPRIADLIPKGRDDSAMLHGGRRGAARFPLRADVALLEPSQSQGYTLNVSEGGLRVVLDRAVTRGERCLLVLRTSDTKEYREHARVVWSREMADGCIAGLEFVAERDAA